MPEYRFIGDPKTGHGPESVEFCGYKIGRNLWTLVSDAAIIAKLDGNSHFERKDHPPIEFSAQEQAERIRLSNLADQIGVPVSDRLPTQMIDEEIHKEMRKRHAYIDDGVIYSDIEGEAVPIAEMDDKEKLAAKAMSLGVAVDGRWGITRLRTEIAMAEVAKYGEEA